MPLHVVVRTPRPSSRERISDALRLGAIVLAGLRESGLLERMAGWIPFERKAGSHGSKGLVAFSVAFLLAGRTWGIRPLIQAETERVWRALAGIAGLRGLPSSSTISEMLASLDHARSRAFADRVLATDPGVGELLRNPQVSEYDAHGRPWHVLDVDPTVEPFRQRALPEGEDLPVAKRRAVGSPGYTGHKRGEIRVRHVPVQHAGTGLWLGYRYTEASESVLPLLSEILGVAKTTLHAASVGDRIVVRGDGEFGSAGAMRTCLDGGVDFVTRVARYALLDREEVARTLSSARWTRVPSSGGGPVREAAELGTFELHPSPDAAGPGHSVSARIVVTRIQRTGKPDHGVVRDGYQYELFATSLAADAWPAGDLVALYFARSAIENRFAQEDREFGIDRTFSHHPPGQEWMASLALFCWNHLICRGVATAPLPERSPAQEPFEAPAMITDAPAAEQPAPSPVSPVRAACSAAAAMHAAPSSGNATAPRIPPPAEPVASFRAVAALSSEQIQQELWTITREAFTPLDDGWRLDDERREIRCPQGKRLFLFAADSFCARTGRGSNRLMVRTEKAACDGCPLRQGCSSHRANSYKLLGRRVAQPIAARAQQLLHASRSVAALHAAPKAATRESLDARLLPAYRPPEQTCRGPLVPRSPTFLPAEARARVRRLARSIEVAVELPRHPRVFKRHHPLLAFDASDRRHTRLTFTKREAALATDLNVVLVATSRHGRALIGAIIPAKVSERAA